MSVDDQSITGHKPAPPTRTFLLSVLCALTVAYIGWVFWWQDGQYSRPTPRPVGLYQPPLGSQVSLPPPIAAIWKRRPHTILFLHFYNPYCPCSRFNLDHVRSLFEAAKGNATFIALVQGSPSRKVLSRLAEQLGGMPVELDINRAVAESLGVYATPQAVIIDPQRKLRFRGNYNSSRYCTDTRTEYARLALEAALQGKDPVANQSAETSYGCPLRKTSNSLLPELLN